MTDIATISALPIGAFFGDKPPLTYRDGKPILTINGVEHDAEELLRRYAGWRLVPVEPNEDQIRALFTMNSALPRTTEEAKAVYCALLNLAAQEPRHDR